MRIFLTVLLSCLSFMVCLSQKAPQVIPPSPTAQAFQKYGNIPISAYTGLPNLSIPIMTIASGDIQIPIDISYHASGIKISEEASKVGLGWVLNTSGMISRSIIGGDDYVSSTNYSPYHTNAVPELVQYVNSGVTSPIQIGCSVNVFNATFTNGTYDNEPDQYYYSLPGGKSGKFILKRNKDVILAKDEKIEIKVLDADATRWSIRTPDGFKYEFDIYESYYGNELINEFGYHKTAWYLTKIISPKGATISFKYTVITNNPVKTIGAYSESRSDVVFGSSTTNGTNIKEDPGCPISSAGGSSVPGRDYTNVQIDSIKFNEGFVKFIYSDREDIVNDKKLDRIEMYVKRSINPATYELVKKTDFLYEYFIGKNDRDFAITSIDLESKRLKLKSVSQKSKNDVKQYDHKFEYFNEYDGDYSIPAKTSFARDHWGYYNGRIVNASLIPTFTAVPSSDRARFYIGVMGDQRDPMPSVAQMFTLSRIWYPTGGYTNFEYETNDFDVANSFVRDNSYFSYNPDADSKTKSIVLSGSVNGPQPATFADALQSGKYIDLTYAYKDTYATSIPLAMSAFFQFGQAQSTCIFGNPNITFELVSESGAVMSSANIFELLNSPTPPSAFCTQVSQSPVSYSGIKYENTYFVAPGRYFWRLNVPVGVTLISTVSANFQYYESKRGIDYGGGLRVKRVYDYESPTATPQVTRYDYHYWADKNSDGQPEEYSYGRRMANPNYSYFEESRMEYCEPLQGITICWLTTCETLKRISDSNISLVNSGSAVAYDQVTVYYGENGENGKTEFIYNNLPDQLLPFQASTYLGTVGAIVPRRSPAGASVSSSLNGMLKRQNDFRYVSPGVFDTLKTVTNQYYEGHIGTSAMVWAVERRDRQSSVSQDSYCTKTENYIYPALPISWVYLLSTEEKLFSQVSTSSIAKKTTNTYGNNQHFFITAQKIETDGRKYYTSYRYPLDFQDNQCSPAVLAMKNTFFMHQPVLETRLSQEVNSVINELGQDITQYDFFNSNTMVLPRKQASYKLLQPSSTSLPNYVPVSGFDTTLYQTHYMASYNSSGEIAVIKKPNDFPASYLWGYQGEHPIAEVKNTTPNLVFHTSFEDFGEGNSADNDAKTGRKSKTGGFTKVLTGLTPQTYTLTYWLKNTVWQLQSLTVVVSGTNYTISLSGQVDEVRFCPQGAQMTTYTYDPLVGMTSTTDANNVTSYYEYDTFNRLLDIKDDKGNILKAYTYHYYKQ